MRGMMYGRGLNRVNFDAITMDYIANRMLTGSSGCAVAGQISRSGMALKTSFGVSLTNHSPTLQVAARNLSTACYFELAVWRSGDKVTPEFEEAGATTFSGKGVFHDRQGFVCCDCSQCAARRLRQQ
jgi:hypothetical protein